MTSELGPEFAEECDGMQPRRGRPETRHFTISTGPSFVLRAETRRALDKLKQLPRDQLLNQPVAALGLNRAEMQRVIGLVEAKRQKSLKTEHPEFVSIGEMAESLDAEAYHRGRGIGEKRLHKLAALRETFVASRDPNRKQGNLF